MWQGYKEECYLPSVGEYTNPTTNSHFSTPVQFLTPLHLHSVMSDVLCLGQFIIPLHFSQPIILPDSHQAAFLQRGTRRVHVWCSPRLQLVDLSQLQSDTIGPLLGPVGSCSTPISEEGIQPNDQSILKIRAFVVTKGCTIPQLRGCIFSLSQNEELIVEAFREAQLNLTLIWNYDPNVFYNIPQTTRQQHQPSSINAESFFRSSLGQCRTTLKHHQCQALHFLLNNECANNNKLHDFWMHHDNNWIRQTCDQSNLDPEDSQTSPCQGSILADDMGLGKTLTTLMFVLGTSHMARDFQRSDLSNPPVQCAATLIICPLATLSNWEKEIETHFRPGAIPYVVFHGRGRKGITREELSSSLVVLTTYEMIGPSGNPQHPNQLTIESLAMSWYRIVLDEAQ